MKKKNRILLIGIVLVVIVIFVWQKNVKKAEVAVDDCKKKAEVVCLEYGIMNVTVDISYSSKYGEYDVYILTVNGAFNNVPMADIYWLVKSLDSLMVELDNTLLLTKVILNNQIYRLDVLNKNELTCEDVTVYTYVSEKEKVMRESLKDTLPYEGMAEEYIGYTKLGNPEKEYCRDYFMLQERARHITYTWRDSSGNMIAEATVTHWDFAEKRSVDGYISSIWFSIHYNN